MTDRTTSASRPPERHDDRAELARLLPAPADVELPREQHLRHKELLMHEIDREQTQPARPARRLLRPALLAPATALAVACAVTAGLAFSGDDGKPGTSQQATDMRPAAALLHRISDVAGKKEAPTVRDDQFVYTKEKSNGAELGSGKAEIGPLETSESWQVQKPGPVKRLGTVRRGGETIPLNAELGDEDGTKPGLHRPTYRWLSSLPTDPDKLLDYLSEHARGEQGREHDQEVFEEIGNLLGGLMPPRTAAALYQAAARIPGVTEAPKAHDAIGRTGLGIARNDTKAGVRTEWVFDEKDYTYLGSRSYLIKDRPYGKAGTLLSSEAELAHGVADKDGERPSDPETTTTATNSTEQS